MIKEPLRLIQTRLKTGETPEERGNCLPTVIACMMHVTNPEEVFQVQLHFDNHGWFLLLHDWLTKQGWEMGNLYNHQMDGSYYLVTGPSPRGNNIWHICIYQNGKLWHDPHPSGDGVLEEICFEYLQPLN